MSAPETHAPVASVSKAAAVLRAFSPTVAALSIRQLSGRTGIPRSTVHAICQTLVHEGFLEAAPVGYQLGPMVLRLGGQVIERTGLVRAAEGILNLLLRSPEQEVHLGQLTQGWVFYVDRAAGPRRAAMNNQVGQRAPAFLTGCGKAALSLLPFAEVEERVKRCCAETDRQLPDLYALDVELAAARAQGLVVSRSFQRDRTSVAAPVVDSDRRPVGGISVAGPDTMFTSAVLAAAKASVLEAAGTISLRLTTRYRP